MHYYLSPLNPKTRDECEAGGALYCDGERSSQVPIDPTVPQDVYHADARVTDRTGPDGPGIIFISCPHCGMSFAVDQQLFRP